ncbi:MAG: flagellar hook-associated protein FlgL [Chitinispirillales bacterium]|jgi:flagellar hook-associated protein 3 FlgL|nr:flagellar hook-associated protein FlgL [Chitinispirillales bacterium]
MVRTTFNTVNRQTQASIVGKFSELAALQKKMTLGKELNRPSDGPVEVANVLKLKTQNSQLKEYEKNIHDGLAWLQITDTVMMTMDSSIRRARDLAIEGDTDALSPTERKYINDEIEVLTREMISLVNTRYKGDYLFSGCEIDKPAIVLKDSKSSPNHKFGNEMAYFDGTGAPIRLIDPNGDAALNHSNITKILPGSLEIAVGGVSMVENVDYKVDYMTGEITLLDEENKWGGVGPGHPMAQDFSPPITGLYSNLEVRLTYMDESKNVYGDKINTGGKIYRQIEEGVSVAINTTVSDFAVDLNNDIFTSFIKLGQALIQNDHNSILEAMKDLDANLDRILSAQSTNGSIVNRFGSTLERNEGQQTEVTRLQSQLEDADYATVVTDYMIKQTVFNNALNSAARIMQLSLADYLR